MAECETYRDEILEAASVRRPMSAEAREHLHSCEQCWSLFAATDSMVRGVRGVPLESPSPETTNRILAAARERFEQRRANPSLVRRWVTAGVVAASLILFATGMILLRSSEEPMNPEAVAALEKEVDRGLDRVRSEMDPVWPESGWGMRSRRDVSSRIDSFQARLERFRTRSRSETFPLDFIPDKNNRHQEGRGKPKLFQRRYLS